MLHPYALMSSSRSFYYVLGLWYYIMWHVMWLQCHMPLHCPKENQKEKEKENKINIKLEKLDKRKEKLLVSKVFYNTTCLLPWSSCYYIPISDPSLWTPSWYQYFWLHLRWVVVDSYFSLSTYWDTNNLAPFSFFLQRILVPFEVTLRV